MIILIALLMERNVKYVSGQIFTLSCSGPDDFSGCKLSYFSGTEYLTNGHANPCLILRQDLTESLKLPTLG